MTDLSGREQFEQVVRKIDPNSKLISIWQLEGGLSAQVTGLEIQASDGQAKKLILRRHGEVDRKNNPHIARDEFKLLQFLHAQGLPSPQAIFVDESCEIFDIPYIVVDFITGATVFAPRDVDDCVRQLANNLVRIHQIMDLNQDLMFLPTLSQLYRQKINQRPEKLDESIGESRIRDALESIQYPSSVNEAVLLHGDYWLGNVLWVDDKLVGIIDWEDAKWGDPIADLALSRLELLFTFGIDAMDLFTRHYQASMKSLDYTNLPIWDLYAALEPANRIAEWAGSPEKEKTMREEHRLFVDAALIKLPFYE